MANAFRPFQKPTMGEAVRTAQTMVGQPPASEEVPADQSAQMVDRNNDGIPDFVLPDDGPEPDGSDPEALRLYKEKQGIHAAYRELDDIFKAAHPGRDFKGEYASMMAEQQAGQAARPGQGPGHAASRGLAKLASFNPANKEALSDFDAQTDEAKGQYDQSFARRMMLKQQMHEGKSAEAEKAGNHAVALKEAEKAELARAETASIAHVRQLERDAQLLQGKKELANIKSADARAIAEMRARSVAAAHGLKGDVMNAFLKSAMTYLGHYFGPQDINKDYSGGDIESLALALDHMAELAGAKPGHAAEAVADGTTVAPAKGKKRFDAALAAGKSKTK